MRIMFTGTGFAQPKADAREDQQGGEDDGSE